MNKWVEAMRPRTLPVSVAGVLAGYSCALFSHAWRWLPAVCCLLFALLAQIASNFANEYFDFKAGLDRKGREGFRRGVTEGDISPRAMRNATFITLALACCVGLLMMASVGEWWLLAPGVAIALFALAYSTGPYPLSHHGLGDIAVIIFFGVVPVTLTCYVISGSWGEPWLTWPTSVSVGILAANVLIVNNYRDAEDDRAVGKHTTAVIFGLTAMQRIYLIDGFVAMALMWKMWDVTFAVGGAVIPLFYLAVHCSIWHVMRRVSGHNLNPLLGKTAVNLLFFVAMVLAAALLTTRVSALWLL